MNPRDDADVGLIDAPPVAEVPSLPAKVPNWRDVLPWYLRLFDTLSSYLPLVIMAVLALGSWWLVKNTPLLTIGREAAPLRHDPDYTMTSFMVQRFAADGEMKVQIEGDLLRHYPDTDTFEIQNPRIRTIDDQGRTTLASALEGLSNRDGSDVQLSGHAHVVRQATADAGEIDFRGEFLHYFQYTERLRSHLPVVVTQGGSRITADAFDYDNLMRSLDFKGDVHAVLSPPEPPEP